MAPGPNLKFGDCLQRLFHQLTRALMFKWTVFASLFWDKVSLCRLSWLQRSTCLSFPMLGSKVSSTPPRTLLAFGTDTERAAGPAGRKHLWGQDTGQAEPAQKLDREACPHLLGIGFLHQAGPKFLVASARMHKEEVLAYDRQSVINHYFHPVATLPELEKKKGQGYVLVGLGQEGVSVTTRPKPKHFCNLTSMTQ